MNNKLQTVPNKFKNEVKQPIKNRSCVYDLHYHLVWVTKYRNKAFLSPTIAPLKNKLKQIASNNGITVQAIEVMPNHVHMLVSAKPKVSVTVMMSKLKGISGKWLFMNFPNEMHRIFWHHRIWSHTYYTGSVGNTTEAVVKHYVNTQKERPYQ